MSQWRNRPELQRLPRRFLLRRVEDRKLISGTGYVAAGVRFPDGTCVMRWMTDNRSTAIYESVAVLLAIHGHEGDSFIDWIDPEIEDLSSLGLGATC